MSAKLLPEVSTAAEQSVQIDHPSAQAIWQRAVEVFDGESLAAEWMNTPMPQFGMDTPQAWADSGDPDRQREVLYTLARLDYGMFG